MYQTNQRELLLLNVAFYSQLIGHFQDIEGVRISYKLPIILPPAKKLVHQQMKQTFDQWAE
jgi:hypothetical protein